MKAAIGVYDNHEMALNAVVELKNAGIPVKNVSIIGLSGREDVDDDLHVMPHNPIKAGGLAAGTVLGTTLGILTGIGMFAIPGVGFLYGAGAIVGAVAGFDFGLIGGGLISVITSLGVEDEAAKQYHDDLEAGKYLLVSQGTPEEVKQAETILNTHNTHSTLGVHPPATNKNADDNSFVEGSVEKLDKEFPLSGGEQAEEGDDTI